MNAYDVRPYAHGPLPTPFENSTRQIGGGVFDPGSGLLYLIIQKADRAQGTYANPPVVVVYRFAVQGNLSVSLKAYLHGAYNRETSQMRTALRARSDFPLTQPYNVEPWLYNGTETVVTVPENIVDWVLVRLRMGDPENPPMTIEATRAAFIRADGMVVDLDGVSPVEFLNQNAGDYYIELIHRNHLSAMTANPVTLGAGMPFYDFTLTPTSAYGHDLMDLGTGITKQAGPFALYGGDLRGDGVDYTLPDNQVNFSGPEQDKLGILNALGLLNLSSGLALYHPADLNMDGEIQYVGSAPDPQIIMETLGLGNLSGSKTSQVPP